MLIDLHQTLDTYRTEIKALTHIAGVELPMNESVEALSDVVAQVLFPALMKLAGRSCPPQREIRRAVDDVFGLTPVPLPVPIATPAPAPVTPQPVAGSQQQQQQQQVTAINFRLVHI